MSYKIANTSWVQLAFSGVLIAGICLFHSSLHQVIVVQLIMMAVLFVFVTVPFLIASLTDPKDALQSAQYRPIRLIRRVAEDEVIAEFLKGEFDHPAFRSYQQTLREIVLKPNLADGTENTIRRALLFIRHLSLWKELPADTKWYEVEVSESDLDQIRIFPRAQWRKLARGNFSISWIIEGMRTHPHLLDAPFLSKIAAIGDQLRQQKTAFGAVILIGLGQDQSMTVLDGNHRLVSAMLSRPSGLPKLRFMCGLSPRMTECCWYNTNLVTLFRYGRNVLSQALHNPETELEQLLQNSELERPRVDAASGSSGARIKPRDTAAKKLTAR